LLCAEYRSLESDLARLKEDRVKHAAAYERRIEEHADDVGDYKKVIKSLSNEKAVLSAAVEARDSKLGRMEELKQEVQSLKQQVGESRNLQSQTVSTAILLLLSMELMRAWELRLDMH